MNNTTESIPYFDTIFEELNHQDSVLAAAFGNHVHWGFWPEPETAEMSLDSFLKAADQLSEQHFAAASITDNLKILDTGCGFGGSISLLNDHYQNLELHGVNIDPRQIERAKDKVVARAGSGNTVDFKVGDACKLDFSDASFDIVMAVECIFHFPSRLEYFKEAYRVLKPGGRLVISDFVVYRPTFFIFALMCWPYLSLMKKYYGDLGEPISQSAYHRLADTVAFKLLEIRNITEGTLPTYKFLEKFTESKGIEAKEITRLYRFQHLIAKLGLQRYLVLAFQKA